MTKTGSRNLKILHTLVNGNSFHLQKPPATGSETWHGWGVRYSCLVWLSSHLLTDKVNASDDVSTERCSYMETSIQQLLCGTSCLDNDLECVGRRWLLTVRLLAVVGICRAPLRFIGLIPHQRMHLKAATSSSALFNFFSQINNQYMSKSSNDRTKAPATKITPAAILHLYLHAWSHRCTAIKCGVCTVSMFFFSKRFATCRGQG